MKIKAASFSYLTQKTRESFEVQFQVNGEGEFYFRLDDIPAEIISRAPRGLENLDKRAGRWSADKKTSDLIYSTRLSNLHEGIIETIRQYEDTLVDSSETKVIAYKFELDGVKKHNKNGTMVFFKEDKYSYRDSKESLGIQFEWKILRQITNKSKLHRNQNKITYLDSDNREHDCYGYNVIHWTELGEAWFIRMEEQMRHMMLSLESFMKLKKTQVSSMIAQGGGLLLSAPTKKNEKKTNPAPEHDEICIECGTPMDAGNAGLHQTCPNCEERMDRKD